MPLFNTIFVESPPWLATGNAQKYMFNLGLIQDALLSKLNQAMLAHMPGEGTDTALVYIGDDRVIGQGPNETNAQYILRLTQAFDTWDHAGSAAGILGQVFWYFYDPTVVYASVLPTYAVVSGNSSVTTWNWYDTSVTNPSAQAPSHRYDSTANWNWNGADKSWWAWLILYFSLLPTGKSGTSANIGAATGGSYVTPGHNVSGVWVPYTSGGTPLNYPFQPVTNLTGAVLSAANQGQWLTITGATHAENNGTFQITNVTGATACVIANPGNLGNTETGVTWVLNYYPQVGPGPVFGQTGFVWGEGEATTPPVDTGSLQGGVWAPAVQSITTTVSFGLNVAPSTFSLLRNIMKLWKGARTYYDKIIVSFDGGNGTAGNAFSPLSTSGSGNPDGTFGSPGKLVAGVWVPARQITSSYDCYCDGTGSYVQCSVQNDT